MNKEFNSIPIYEINNKTYIKSKLKEFGDTAKTYFYGNKIPKQKTPYKCLSMIMLESFLRIKEYCYHPQTFLEQCKHDVNNIKRSRCIDYDFDKSSSDQSDNVPDSETYSEPDSCGDDNKCSRSSKKPY